MAIICSSPSPRSKLKWIRLFSGLFHLPQIQSSKLCFQSFLFAHAGLIFLDKSRLEVPAIAYAASFSTDIARRAHQGFGWIGEWANTRLVM